MSSTTDDRDRAPTTAIPARALADTEILKCFPVMSELRTRLDEASFMALIRAMEREG